jgi:hypothetical protein
MYISLGWTKQENVQHYLQLGRHVYLQVIRRNLVFPDLMLTKATSIFEICVDPTDLWIYEWNTD